MRAGVKIDRLKSSSLLTAITAGLCLLAASFATTAFADQASTPEKTLLEGKWKYVAYFYRGDRHPPPNPTLELLFKFESSGSSQIYWSYKGLPGFCERLGRYEVFTTQVPNQYILEDLVVWVNPQNNPECGRDPDMQLGKRTRNPVELKAGAVWLELSLAGEPLYYILEKI
jgi:hypothetical protein